MTTLKKNTLKTIIALFLLALIGSPLTAMAQEGATSSDAVIYPARYQLNSIDSVNLAEFYQYGDDDSRRSRWVLPFRNFG